MKSRLTIKTYPPRITCSDCEILSQRVDGFAIPYGVRLCIPHSVAVHEEKDLKDLLCRLARHIRNSEDLPPLQWGVQGLDLLAEVRAFFPERYDREVK